MKSVRWILQSLNFDYAHVVVYSKNGNFPLGGGTPGYVIKCFGDYLVVSSSIQDNILHLCINL